MSDDLRIGIHDLLFGVRRSIRYHYRKVRFFDGLHKTSVFLSAVTGTATLTAILSNAGSVITLIFAGIVTFFSVLDLVVGTARKARAHNDFARRYFALEKAIITLSTPTKEDLSRLTIERLDIEADEPPPCKVLDIMCHNELVRACGYDESNMVKIKWHQRLCAHLFNFREHTIRPPAAP